MKPGWIIRSLRVGVLFIFLCSFVRLISDYDVTDDILISFPMYPIFVFFDALKEKTIASILFPLFISIIFCFPIRKSYSSIYGILVIERIKTFFMIIGYTFVFIGATLFQRSYSGEEWGLFISIVYFIWLQFGLKGFDRQDFLSYIGVKKTIDDSGKSYIAVLMVNCIVYLVLAIELYICYNDARMPVCEIKIQDALVQDISSNGEYGLSITKKSSKETPLSKGDPEDKWETSLIDLIKRDSILIERSVAYSTLKFARDDQYICMAESDHKGKKEDLVFYTKGMKEIKKMHQLKGGENASTRNFRFNYDGKYLLTIGWSASLWDYENGKCMVNYKGIYDLVWMGNNSYIAFQSYDDLQKGYKVKISLNEILKDGCIQETVKPQMTHDIENKVRRLKKRDEFLREFDEKLVCVVTTGVAKNNFLNYESHIVFFDVEREKDIFSLSSGNEIVDVVFIPNTNRFLVIERMKNKKIRIGVWDLEKKKREKTIFLQGANEGSDRRHVKVIEGGGKLVVMGETTKIWSLE